MPDQPLELQPVAPHRGEWQRQGEHESMLEVACGRFKIKLSYMWCNGKEMERWLVETLHMWPHPNAPTSEDEYNYPKHRQESYARLMAE